MAGVLAVYIDEAGDPGVRDGTRYATSRHEWLCVSAVIVRSARHDLLPTWIAELREAAKSTQSGSLHYERIAKARRKGVCELLAAKPLRVFVLATHKSNMREYINPRIGSMLEGGTFYNWCLRLLLERVTAWADTWFRSENLDPTPLEIVFAQRGHNYDHFFSYIDLLRMQKAAGTLFLRGPGLTEPFLDRSFWSITRADQLAGLQLADIAASAFYQAANTVSPSWDVEPAKALRPVIAEKDGIEANVGLTVWPLPQQATIPEGSREIFRHYGYQW